MQMHELRRDILLGRWVEVLSESLSPSDYLLVPDNTPVEETCALCPGRERETPVEITSMRMPNGNRWSVRALPSLRPMFQIEGDLGRRGVGIYDKMNNIGANEILVESPEHSTRPEDMGVDQMVRVITLYRNRIADLERDSRIRYISKFMHRKHKVVPNLSLEGLRIIFTRNADA
ncbi:MAG: galT, partial [Nitrospirae bacterium]|nr:galT [Nitrospirota bacterium]